MLREHEALLETRLAAYDALSSSLARAKQTTLVLARQRQAAMEAAHAGGGAALAQVISARRDAREAELQVLDLEERLATTGAELTLEYGEAAP
jgi:hypothetical protein